MIVLTTPVVIGTISQMSILSVNGPSPRGDLGAVVRIADAQGREYADLGISICNGLCWGLKIREDITDLRNVMEQFTVEIETGLTDCLAAMAAGGNALPALEAWAMKAGLLPDGTVER